MRVSDREITCALCLCLTGKNVWLPCDGETKDQEGNNTREKGTSLSFLPPLNDNDRLVLGSRRPSPPGAVPQPPGGGPHRFLVKPVVRVRSNLNEHGPRCVDYAARAFDTPPKKKHCRSLSVPADTPPQGMGTAAAASSSTSPLVEGAKVWRPIPITALSTPGGGGCSSSSGSVGQPDTRTLLLTHFASPHHDSRTLSSFTAIGSTAARFHRDFKVVGGGGGGGGCGGGVGIGVGVGGVGTTTTTTTTTLPMAPSPLSIDSGRDTTSDLHTPPQSPVPRPSSATSLRSCHATAFSASWWSHSPGRSLRGEVLQSRSLSYEEQMPTGLQAAASGSSPCVVGSGGSVPLSPCRSKIPRCHSQPCVLHHRRCGKKRRREDRPTLDFHKMTEVGELPFMLCQCRWIVLMVCR